MTESEVMQLFATSTGAGIILGATVFIILWVVVWAFSILKRS